MRGKLRIIILSERRNRITPACAGKTSDEDRTLSDRRDHPRVCGENDSSKLESAVYEGSPPRVRGKPYETIVLARDKRITPACAGKTIDACDACSAIGDHPRVCGENSSVRNWRSQLQGSPPRVRGKLKGKIFFIAMCGITPACAGKTSETGKGSGGSGDHPRVCGENYRSSM